MSPRRSTGDGWRRLVLVAAIALGFAACSAAGADGSMRSDSVGGAGGAAGSAGPIGFGATGNASGSGSLPADGGCAYANLESQLLPSNLLFVVDRTGTMNCNAPPTTTSAVCQETPTRQNPSEPSKWQLLSSALKQAWAELRPEASVGLSFFSNNDICGVNSVPTVGVNPLNATQLGSLGTALDAVKPGGGTPMVGATVVAYQHLHQEARLAGNKFVVLITDGEDNCDAAKLPLLQTEIPKALAVNIRTFVIGAPGSEQARALLSQMAWLGGTAQSATCNHAGNSPDKGDCHFDMTTTQDFGKDLASALQAISGRALTCEFDVPTAPGGASVDFRRLNVRYTRSDGSVVEVPQDANRDCTAGAQGWQYAQANTKIVLCGSVCDEIKADAKAKIEIVLGCQTRSIR